jgi:hypothetical protein
MYAIDFFKALVHCFDTTRRITHMVNYEDRCRMRGYIPVWASQETEYDVAWRTAVVAEVSLCETCSAPAVVAHRIRPVSLYKELALHVSNGVSLCYACHGKVHVMLRCKNISSVDTYERLLANNEAVSYTVEALSEATGFSVKSIYNLTSYGCLPAPVRGLDQTLYRSKGAYSELALRQLRRYSALKEFGERKERIIQLLNNELKAELYQPVLALPVTQEASYVSVQTLAATVGMPEGVVYKLSSSGMLPVIVGGSMPSDALILLRYAMSSRDMLLVLKSVMSEYYTEVTDVSVR